MNNISFFPSDPVVYEKGKVKTNTLVPTDHVLVGYGFFGQVFGLGQIEGRRPLTEQEAKRYVIKKSLISMEQEYTIGRKLRHPNLLPSLALFIKTYPDNQTPNPAKWGNTLLRFDYVDRKVYKLVMERIKGSPLSSYDERSPRFSKEAIKALFFQVQSVSEYLLKEQICWADLNLGNIYIEEAVSGVKLLIADYGRWALGQNRIGFIRGLHELIRLILCYSDLSDQEKTLLFDELQDVLVKSYQNPALKLETIVQESFNTLTRVLFPESYIQKQNLIKYFSSLNRK